jgi:hypothetical protein
MNGPDLSAKQRATIAALIVHGDILHAAKAAEVSRSSVYSWLQQPAFAAALRQAEAAALKDTTRQMAALTGQAIATLRALLTDPTTSEGGRLRAAGMVLDHFLRFRETADYEGRLAELERLLGATYDVG